VLVPLLAILVPSVVLILGGLVKLSNQAKAIEIKTATQAGRIEEQMKSFSERLSRLESLIDNHFSWRNSNPTA
jgi:hypothetical protein